MTYPTITVISQVSPSKTQVVRRDGSTVAVRLSPSRDSWLPLIEGLASQGTAATLGDLGVSSRAGAVSFGANYTYLDATYQSEETVNGVGNSTNDAALAGTPGVDGSIRIQRDTWIPLIPEHLFKTYADFQAKAEFLLGLNLIAVGSSYARGNENNAHQPDGVTYLGPGKASGYAVLNLNAEDRADPRLKLFGQITNLFDRKYSSAALLGPTGFTGSGNFIARPFPPVEYPVQQATFYAPGARAATGSGCATRSSRVHAGTDSESAGAG